MPGKIDYSGSVYDMINPNKLKREIMTATESSPQMRAEIRRIFQKANRRIQNIESAELYSPAVAALGPLSTNYTKFSMSGSWEELKRNYGRAVAFLREPTSTATGTRQYHEHIRAAYDLTKDEYDLMLSNYMGKVLSLSDSKFVEQYLMVYKDFTGELETEAADVSTMIESDAVVLQDVLQSDIRHATDSIVSDAIDDLMSEIDSMTSI